MKLRHIYKLFDEINFKVFEGKLPKVKINLSRHDRGSYGVCNTKALKGQTAQGLGIMLSIPSMLAAMPFTTLERSIKHILIHEMVHLFQYTCVKNKIYGLLTSSEYDWHDEETFYVFGHRAVEAGILDTPELIEYEV